MNYYEFIKFRMYFFYIIERIGIILMEIGKTRFNILYFRLYRLDCFKFE